MNKHLLKKALTACVLALCLQGVVGAHAADAGKTVGSADYVFVIISSVIFVLLCAVVVFLLLKIRRIKKENAVDKITDAETGMGNLLFFKHHFKYSIDDASRNFYYLTYIILDISYLRSYHGESSFEDVLKYTSSVLSEHTQNREFSARITENGFAVAYQALDDDDALKKLKETMNELNGFENFKQINNKLVFHAAVYHLSSTDKNCEILLFNLRKNCNKIFGTDKQIVMCDVHSMNRIQEEKKMTESILDGLEKNEFKMYLQFIVDNKTKDIVSAEALSRWDSPSKGILLPAKYIGNMESAGLISRHDYYMFELACRQLEKWKDTEFSNVSISCNFTRITLSEEDFAEKIKTISNAYSFDKSKLAIEITEDAMERNLENATNNMELCKHMGFRVYLDDLGSGYTSLANICDYPIDVVKIDRDILLKTERKRGKDLFCGIIALAHSIGAKIICEGVETEQQNSFVSESACDYLQGWYYSRPTPAEDCESFVEGYNKNRVLVKQ